MNRACTRKDQEIAFRELLEETLTLWGIEGDVIPSEAGDGMLLLSRGQTTLEILLAAPEEPARWIVREMPAGIPRRPHRCASVVGILMLLRRLLGAEAPRVRPLRLGAATAPR